MQSVNTVSEFAVRRKQGSLYALREINYRRTDISPLYLLEECVGAYPGQDDTKSATISTYGGDILATRRPIAPFFAPTPLFSYCTQTSSTNLKPLNPLILSPHRFFNRDRDHLAFVNLL